MDNYHSVTQGSDKKALAIIYLFLRDAPEGIISCMASHGENTRNRTESTAPLTVCSIPTVRFGSVEKVPFFNKL